MRFIWETICRKFSNCWDTLRALIPKQKDEIYLNGYGLKSLRIGQSAGKKYFINKIFKLQRLSRKRVHSSGWKWYVPSNR